jgi:SAM-dependent methyltransferase
MTMDASEWTGKVGSVWAREWARTDRSFSELAPLLHEQVLAALPAGKAVRLVDIGCGAGHTSISIAKARPDADIVGIDISGDLVAIAEERAAGIKNLRFLTGPADQIAQSLAPVDMFASRHGVMFFADPRAAFAAFRRAAPPGARLVFSCFRGIADNPWAFEVVRAAAGGDVPRAEGYVPGPFAFADPEFVSDVLTHAGWQVDAATPVDYRYVAGEGPDPVGDALSFFQSIGPAAGFLRAADDADRPAIRARIAAVLEAHCHGGTVDFAAAAWLWSATAA